MPDPNIVARLGVAADRALKAASQAHLAELCRLKSPPATARRLVLGLVVALGLRCAEPLGVCYPVFRRETPTSGGGGDTRSSSLTPKRIFVLITPGISSYASC